MKNRFLLSILLVSFFMSACLQHEIDDTPQAIFDEIWNILNERYGGFGPRNVDWDLMYSEFNPLVSNDISTDSLWQICSNLIDVLDDQHVSIYDPILERGHASNKTLELESEKEFSLQNILSNYLEPGFFSNDFSSFGNTNEEIQFVHGMVKESNIAYIYLPHFAFLDDWHEEIDRVVEIYQDTEGMIVDVRNNGGGSPIINRYLAYRFMQSGEFVFSIQDKIGPDHFDFGKPTNYYAKPDGPLQYTKPIISLMNHSSVSAAEEFLLFMESQDHITTLGDTTSNAFSTTAFDEFLPNGWAISFPVQLYLYPDGTSPEGVGILPEYIYQNDTLEVQQGRDQLIEMAIDLL